MKLTSTCMSTATTRSPSPPLPPTSTLTPPLHFTHSTHLASSRARNVRALGALLAASDGVARPSPVGASALGAQDVDGHGVGGDAAGHALDGQAGDGDAGGGSAGGRAVLVVLLDDDAVFGDLGGVLVVLLLGLGVEWWFNLRW